MCYEDRLEAQWSPIYHPDWDNCPERYLDSGLLRWGKADVLPVSMIMYMDSRPLLVSSIPILLNGELPILHTPGISSLSLLVGSRLLCTPTIRCLRLEQLSEHFMKALRNPVFGP